MNPHLLLHRQACLPHTPQPPYCPKRKERELNPQGREAQPASNRVSSPIGLPFRFEFSVSSPTRISNSPSSRERKVGESNPLQPRCRGDWLAPSFLSQFGYLPYQWTHRESNPDYQSAELVSSRWTMSPLDFSGPHGSRTHHTDLARVSRPQRHAGPFVGEVRPGIEPGLRPYHGRVRPKHLQTSSSSSDRGWS